MNLPITGLHIEPTNVCTLKCPGCARTRFIDRWPQHWKNHSLDIQILLDFLDIDLQDKVINLCGNYGDPIYHPNFVELITALKKLKAQVCIITNGSYRRAAWWHELCDNLDSKDQITFSIDGLPENFNEYRINADWQSIKIGVDICVSRNVHTIWKCIPFNFNQLDIDRIRHFAFDLGITEFKIDPSDRFDKQTQGYLPDSLWFGKRKMAQENYKNNITQNVDPRCYKGREHFITADGYFSPCCFVSDHRFLYKTEFGKNRSMYDIRSNTLTKILANPTVVHFYDNILIERPNVCQFNCPKL